jgi:LPS-assembly protein
LSAQPFRAYGPRIRKRPPRVRRHRTRVALLALLLADTCAALAAEPGLFALCRPEHAIQPDIPPSAGPGITVLTAHEAFADGEGTVTMSGDVRAVRDGQALLADHARYDQNSSRIEVGGNVAYLRRDLAVDGDQGEFDLDADSGELSSARFRLFSRHARGEARTAKMLDPEVTVLDDASYTTCDPGDEDWLLRASRVRLDRASGIGTARNARLSFMGVPFLYTPWISFPIDDRRRTGFLYPNVRDSSSNGLELSIPYYLNLAPNYDATVTPRYMKKRGLMLESELRYLGERHEGLVDVSWLRNDQEIQRERSLIGYRHTTHPGLGFNLDIDYNRVSDSDYFDDFGNDLGIASITHLEQRAVLGYQARNWIASARIQRYQTVDEAIPVNSRPYRQEPALTFRSQLPEYNFRPNARIIGTYVDFRHESRLEGQRIEVQPAITFPMHSLAAYLQPTVTLRHTAYHLENATGDSSLQRTVPVVTLDSGIFLERELNWGSRGMIQTLEPRLYYLYVPYRDQSHLPVFDSGVPDFNFSQLFRDNRFNGSDRVGDANQVATALITRFIDAQTGQERLYAGIGRIHYFRDRLVRLSGDPDTARRSDLVAEATATLGQLTARVDGRRSEETGDMDVAGISLQYRPGPRRLLGVGYRFREETLEQTDFTVLWPLGRRWHAVARHNYSLHDRRTLETIAGLEYRSCCWRARLVSRRHLEDVTADEVEYKRSLYLQIEFIGLASLGDDLESLLERGILGY